MESTYKSFPLPPRPLPLAAAADDDDDGCDVGGEAGHGILRLILLFPQ